MIKKQLHWLLYILFVASCAKQTTPTGGPKDTIPPRLVSSIPPHGTINFHGGTIRMEFSEMIAINNPQEQIIITPSVGKDFEVTARKNIVQLELNTTLQDSTTYTFNFRESIQDVTEKNPARNLQIAISTGAYLDSLSIQGKVFDILTSKPTQDATVAIHVPSDTFSILEHPASYFTKTNKLGQYKIDNLKLQTYYVYALTDKNRNLVTDSRSEAYGFLTDSLLLDKDTAGIDIGLVRLDARALAITSARSYNTYFNIKTTKNLKGFSLASPDSIPIFYSFGEDAANIKLYNTAGDRDSIAVRLMAYDSIGNHIDSTLYARFAQRQVTPEPFSLSINSTRIIAQKGLIEASITFTKPVAQLNFDSILFQVDSITTLAFTPDELVYDQPSRTLTIRKITDRAHFIRETPDQPVPANIPQVKTGSGRAKINELLLGRGAFLSVENDTSKRSVQLIEPLLPNQLSIILYDIRTTEDSILVQLLDNKLKVLEQKINIKKGQFNDLQPGQYALRLVIDKNGNGSWDPGNYFLRQEPEPILYYTGDERQTLINLKANWELGPLLITY